MDDPGLLDDSGFVYYNDYVVIDLSVKTVTINFTVNAVSYFRAFIEEHRIDFDLTLRNNTGNLATGIAYGGEEGISFVIYPGNYKLDFSYYGTYLNFHPPLPP